jgi:hypothetical protein
MRAVRPLLVLFGCARNGWRPALRRASVVVALLVMGGAITSATARPALACSASPDFHPVVDSDLIIAGRLLGWERAPEVTGGGYGAIRVGMAVDLVFKGVAPARVTFVDRNSLLESAPGVVPVHVAWVGSRGACGTFDQDPTGQYAILGLRRGADGAFHSGLLTRFAIGAEHGSPAYAMALSRLVGAGEATLNLADPRPCIPATDGAFPAPIDRARCAPERQARWDGDPAAWATHGVTDAAARFAETLLLRANAGDPATIAGIARALGQPYLKVTRVRFTGTEFVEVTNLGGGAQSLAGWSLRSPKRGAWFALRPDIALGPGESCRFYTGGHPPGGGTPCLPAVPRLADLWADEGGTVALVFLALDLLGDETTRTTSRRRPLCNWSASIPRRRRRDDVARFAVAMLVASGPRNDCASAVIAAGLRAQGPLARPSIASRMGAADHLIPRP